VGTTLRGAPRRRRFTKVDREVGMLLQIGQEMVRVTLPPGAVRDGETFVMVLSVEAMTEDEMSEITEREGQRALDGTRSTVSAEVASGPVEPCNPQRREGARS
jgi:hypothetical protein